MQENIQNAIQEALENAPERKFVESFEMAITLKDVDLKNPVNRIKKKYVYLQEEEKMYE
jgi:large subunit ribosomal protein L1